MKKRVIKLLLFISAFALFQNTNIIASSIGGAGSAYFAYEPYNHVFYDRESAVGYVRLCNGFTVTKKASGAGSTHGSIMLMDTNLSVSGAIDLRDTSTLFLQQDLRLENGVTFSSGGNIYGYDKALILDGDLQIPANKVLHFGGRILIEGNGHTLKLNDNAQLFVDTDATLTLRNLVVKNSKNFVGNPAIKLAASGSDLALDNTILNFVGDFYFDRGSIFIHNDVAFTGTSAFVYRSCWPSFIISGATLNFDAGTTFDFRPSTTGTPALLPKDLLNMVDPTSQLYLNGCTLKATTTGLRLIEGQLLFDNNVSITSNTQFDISGYYNSGNPIATSASYGGVIYAVSWSPDGRYVAVGGATANTVKVFQFTGSSFNLVATSASYGGTIRTLAWSPCGGYIAVAGDTVLNLKVYQFTGSALNLLATSGLFLGTTPVPNNLAWSPDCRYIAVGTGGGAGARRLGIYQFTGSSLPLAAADTAVGAAGANGLDWSPDGKYIAVGISTVDVYRFTGSSLTLIDSSTAYGGTVYAVKWSPDGRYIAAGGGTVFTVNIYQFTGSVVVQAAPPISYGGQVNTLSWHPDGKYIAVGGIAANTRIYMFINGTLSLIASSTGYGGQILGLSWSPDAKYVAVGGDTVNTIKAYQPTLVYQSGQQAISNSVVFGNSLLGAASDLNVKFLSNSNVELDGLMDYDNVN